MHGTVVMDLGNSAFLAQDCPTTVNSSLWRLAQLNSRHGLFQVCDRIYQVRNFDISNMTIVVGDSGYIVVDPLYSEETAAAAMELVFEHLGSRPITGMVYTHAHLDHFGGSRGIISHDEALARSVPVVAPDGFMEHTINENIFAGVAEARRNQFMFGAVLPKNPRGQVTSSLGIGVSTGVSTLVPPTTTICGAGQTLVIDGVVFEFQSASGAECPAEFHFTLPEFGATCLAENLSRVMHNIYTLRGAPVRDALKWSKLIDESIEHLADSVDVAFMGHHWPVWGVDQIRHFMGMQRDMYRFMHDETLRLINHGYTGNEIAETLTLPTELDQYWANRGLYGSLSHNVKAIYQRYLGWFDGNPANLNPHPPNQAGARYVGAMGGIDHVIELAQLAYDEGDFRWASELLKHVLAADPDTPPARHLQSCTFEQMGYQAESGPWRNFYLSAAQELRGTEATGYRSAGDRGSELIAVMETDSLLDYLGIRFNGSRESSLHLIAQLSVGDEERYVAVRNGTVRASASLRAGEQSQARMSMSKSTFIGLCRGSVQWHQSVSTNLVEADGDVEALNRFWTALDTFTGQFTLATPRSV
ncbi:MBL fold metallo-hydrolase [Rhodococcus sp. IEGM 248]|nr:MBL fold metallo-hydrolase [Rhodococcus sp. IEGM 248]